MTRDMIIADAEIAAAYMRTLIVNGVKPQAASTLTAAYVRAIAMAKLAGGKLEVGKELEHADTSATYMLALIERGVSRFDAASFAGEYIQTIVFSELSKQKPREPWERGEEGGPG